MTAPTGRRRTSAAICSDVGSRARRGSAAYVGLVAAGRGARCADAREDQPDVAGAEREGDEGEVGGGGALLQGGGEFLAVIDESAHQADEAAEPAGSVLAGHRGVRWGSCDWEGGRGGHEHNKNM